jgi:hypothetical protein
MLPKWTFAAALGTGFVAYGYYRDRRQVQALTAPAPLIVATDLEPDDCFALLVLRLRGVTPKGILVGEGCSTAKVQRMRTLAPYLGWQSAHILQGMPSDTCLLEFEEPRDYLEDTVREPVCGTTSWARTLGAVLDDGFDCRELTVLEDLNPIRQPTLLFLKPPRELVHAEKTEPEEAKKLFARVRLVLYGSYNLRQVGYENVVGWLDPAKTPFQSVILYENHGSMDYDGAFKTLREDNMEPWGSFHGREARKVHSLGQYARRLRAFMQQWDAYILKDCDQTCAAIEETPGWQSDPVQQSRWSRNKSCADAVRPYAGRQIAAADPVLAAILDHRMFRTNLHPVQRASWTPGQPYLDIVDDANANASGGRVARYKGMVPDDIKWELYGAWTILFPEFELRENRKAELQAQAAKAAKAAKAAIAAHSSA